MKFISSLSLALSLASLSLLSVSAVDFQTDVEPILNEKCFKCHSGPRHKGNLRMDTPDNFAKRVGGENPVIVPGDPESSLLAIKAGLPRSDGDAMPPPPARARGAEPMTAKELQLVKQWISAGASFEEGASTAETPDEPEMHEWTNHEGGSLRATFLRAEGSNVVLRLEDGSEIPYPYDKLSPESQALARRLATE